MKIIKKICDSKNDKISIINLRLLTIQDADLLLEWRNDPETRKASQNTDKIQRNEHLSWLKNSLNNNNRKVRNHYFLV